MVVLIDLLKEALKNHYPINHEKIDSTDYPSKTEMWSEWLNPTYRNGECYIGETLPSSMSDIDREVISLWYLRKPNNTGENKYGIGVIVKGFLKTQKLYLNLEEDIETEYTLTNFKDFKESKLFYGELLSPNEILKIRYYATEDINNYIKYKNIPSTTVLTENMNTMLYDDFTNKTTLTNKYSRVVNVQQKLELNEGNSVFSLKWNVGTHTGGRAEFYTALNEVETLNFTSTSNVVNLTTDEVYVICKLVFNDGLTLVVNINTEQLQPYTDCNYLIKY